MNGLWTVQVWSPEPVSKWLAIAGAAGGPAFAMGFYDGITSPTTSRAVYARMRYRILNRHGAEVSRSHRSLNQAWHISPHRLYEVRGGGGQLVKMFARGRKSYCIGYASGLASRYPHPALQVMKLKGEIVVRRWPASGEAHLN